MSIVSTKVETIMGIAGVSLATGPAIKNKIIDAPFYENEWWLGYIAITGAILLTATAITRLIKMKRAIKGESEE